MAPFYKYFSENYSDYINLEVIYFSDYSVQGGFDNQFGTNLKWDIPLLEGYQYKFIKNYSPVKNPASKFFGMINPNIFKHLRQAKPDVVIIPGWSNLSYILGYFSAIILGIDIWVRLETPLNQELLKQSIKAKIKRFFLKNIYFKNVKRCLYIGNENKKFFQYMGIPEHRLFFTPYSVDNDRFRNAYNEGISEKINIRKKIGIPENSIVFLTSGKLIDKKRPLDLIKAFNLANIPDSFLIYLGDGQLREEIMTYARIEDIGNYLITGFKNQTELAPYFIASDVFVLCSGIGETWGLVTNEAMNFNLPIIISDRVGSANDLVHAGLNGFVYQYSNVNDLASKMKLMASEKEKLSEMGIESSKIIDLYNYKSISYGILKAAGVLVNKNVKKTSTLYSKK
jgi:glycosyltransferase involved in cell wall biosynthesis